MKTTHQPAFAGKICGFDFLLLKNILKIISNGCLP